MALGLGQTVHVPVKFPDQGNGRKQKTLMETSFRLGCRISVVKHHVQIALTKPAPIRVRMSLCLATTSYQFVDEKDYTHEKKRVNKCQHVSIGAVSPAVSGFDLQPPQ